MCVPTSKDVMKALKPSIPSANKDATINTTVINMNRHDDKRVSWLQHPLHGSLEKKYYSDAFRKKAI
jgi:hypothetical protein